MVKFVRSSWGVRFTLFVLIHTLLTASAFPAEGRRVAILSAPGLEAAGDLLAAALSSTPGVEVMERDQLARIVREKAIQVSAGDPVEAAKTGRLIGVEALIILDPLDAKGGIVAQLIAVGPSVVVDYQTSAWPLGDPQGWARFLSQRYATLLADLPSSPQKKILVASLGVRSPLVSQASLEREVSFLMNRALVNLPGVFALDRKRMREADFEKQLSETATADFWASTWLFDGNVTGTENHLVLEGRLQPMEKGSAAKTFRVEAPDAPALANAAAEEVARQLSTPAAPSTESSPSEAEQFRAEAEWAARWGQLNLADRSADASWFLGNKTEAMGLLRARMAAALSVRRFFGVTSSSLLCSHAPPTGALEKMLRAFSNLRLAVQLAGDKPSEPFLRDTTEILAQATGLLQAYYYLYRERTPEEEENLRALRAEIRIFAPVAEAASLSKMAELAKLDWRQRSLVPDRPYETPLKFLELNARSAPLWQDTPEESAKAFQEALAAIDSLDPRLADWYDRMRFQVITERTDHQPIVVAWNKADQSRVSEVRQKLLSDMQLRGPRAKLDALTLGFLRFPHYYLPHMQSKVPPEKIQQSLEEFYLGLIDLRKAIIDGTIPEMALVESFSRANAMLNDEVYGVVKPAIAPFRARLLLAFLHENWPGQSAIYNYLIVGATYTPEERDEILQALDAVKKAVGKVPSYYRTQVTNQTVGAVPAATATATPRPTADPLVATQSYQVFSPDETRPYNHEVIYRNGMFFLRKTSESGLEILEIDPAKDAPRTVFKVSEDSLESSWQGVLKGIEAWDLDEQNIYFATEDKLFRVNRETGKMELKPIPLLGGSVGRLFFLKGKLYACLSEGGIVEIDPSTFQAELLASARRRPAQTPLDDCPPYQVRKAIEWNGGIIFDEYLWDPVTRTFSKMPDVAKGGAVGSDYDPKLLLQLIGASGGHGSGYERLLLDASRTGKVPALRYVFVSMAYEKYLSSIDGVTAGGETLYILFRKVSADQGNYLRVQTEKRGFCVPVQTNGPPRGIRVYDQIIASENGVLLWGRDAGKLLFYSLKDLEAKAP